MLGYLKGTIYYCLRYVGDGEVRLHGYVDFYWAVRVLFQLGVRDDILVQHEVDGSSTQFNR